MSPGAMPHPWHPLRHLDVGNRAFDRDQRGPPAVHGDLLIDVLLEHLEDAPSDGAVRSPRGGRGAEDEEASSR